MQELHASLCASSVQLTTDIDHGGSVGDAGNGKSPVEVLSLCSKREGLFVGGPADLATIIARSDSNGEDLEAFAGAGACHMLSAFCLGILATHYACMSCILLCGSYVSLSGLPHQLILHA